MKDFIAEFVYITLHTVPWSKGEDTALSRLRCSVQVRRESSWVSGESANAADCKSVLLGGNEIDTHLAHFIPFAKRRRPEIFNLIFAGSNPAWDVICRGGRVVRHLIAN